MSSVAVKYNNLTGMDNSFYITTESELLILYNIN